MSLRRTWDWSQAHTIPGQRASRRTLLRNTEAGTAGAAVPTDETETKKHALSWLEMSQLAESSFLGIYPNPLTSPISRWSH